MAKRAIKRRAQAKERKTNWTLIGGIIGLGVVGLFALLFASLQGGSGGTNPSAEPTRNFVLADYCDANPQNCIIVGAANAPITVVEVSDYGCGHCRNFHIDSLDTLQAQFVDSGLVRWVRLPYALSGQTGSYPTMPSAVAGFCAYEQGAFETFDKALFALQGTGNFNQRDGFMSVAAQSGLDMEAFATCIDENRYQDRILSNIQAANRSGVSSTPNFFVNGQLVRGNLPLANFQQLLNAELGS
jgi:protein-disulfide isomerase